MDLWLGFAHLISEKSGTHLKDLPCLFQKVGALILRAAGDLRPLPGRCHPEDEAVDRDVQQNTNPGLVKVPRGKVCEETVDFWVERSSLLTPSASCGRASSFFLLYPEKRKIGLFENSKSLLLACLFAMCVSAGTIFIHIHIADTLPLMEEGLCFAHFHWSIVRVENDVGPPAFPDAAVPGQGPRRRHAVLPGPHRVLQVPAVAAEEHELRVAPSGGAGCGPLLRGGHQVYEMDLLHTPEVYEVGT